MLGADMRAGLVSAKLLVEEKVASRLHSKDASLYDFSDQAQECARNFMGWTDLASNPPMPIEDIQSFARKVLSSGIDTVLLIGEGGSTQAPMTITKYHKADRACVKFRVLDSDSPVRVRAFLAECNPETTVVLISSKSGSTIEPRLALMAIREELSDRMSPDRIVKRLIAITDPGSDLEKQAIDEGWLAVFNGEPSVGGRFSALSVFGLLPAALAEIDICEFMEHACEAERLCSEDSLDNPAIRLAGFLYDNYLQGRDKVCFLAPKRGRVLGLWIEQLVAESLGKEGKGILPNIETDPLMFNEDHGDGVIVTYQTKTDLWDERKNFEMSMAYLNRNIPRLNYRIENVCELAGHFLIWEYAIAMCGYLMKVCPFDQPDVASAKAATLDILRNGHVAPDFIQEELCGIAMGEIEVRLSSAMKGAQDLEQALHMLLGSIRHGDYFSLNAFLPFTGEGRREALEIIRHTMAEEFGVVSCLEIGPRYLHSTGQLHKGGPDTGVFLIISADELKDIPLLRAPAPSLASLAKAQAEGDLVTLSNRGRRCLHVHLPDNSGATMRQLAALIQKVARNVSA